MRFRTTLFLAGTLALLGVAYYLLELRAARQQAEAKLTPFDEKDVTGFTIRRGDQVITLTRGEKGWRMRQPVEDQGDEREVASLLGNVTRATIERTLEAQREQTGDFGLQTPATVLTADLKGKEQPFTLEVGGSTPTGLSVYARRPGEEMVLIIPATVKTSLEKEPFAFRSKAALLFDRDAVKSVSLRSDSRLLLLERQEKDQWRLTQPTEVKADSRKVSDLFLSLTQDQVKSFLDQVPPDLHRLGLDPPRREIRLTLEGGAELGLLLGAQEGGEGTYARRAGDAHVLVLKEGFSKQLPDTVADLRDRTLLAFDRGQVAQIELQSPKGRTLLKKEDAIWRIKEPEEASADARAVEGLLLDLASVRVKEFVTEDAKSLKPYGLDTPAVTIGLSDQAGRPLTSLAANRADKQEGLYVRVDSSPAVSLVDVGLYERIAKGPSDLRLRQLLSFETWDVGRMVLSRDGREILLEKRKERWELKKPSEGRAKYSAVNDLLNEIRDLKWEKVVSKESTELSRYGLDRPAATLTLIKADEKPIGTLLFGKAEGEALYAKTQEGPEIYAVPSTFLKSLPENPAALLE
jgi:hypothetical protein